MGRSFCLSSPVQKVWESPPCDGVDIPTERQANYTMFLQNGTAKKERRFLPDLKNGVSTAKILMRFKNFCAVFLLSIASVYFVCPVQCAAIGEADTGILHQRDLTDSESRVNEPESSCCNTKDQSVPTHENREERGQHCCFNRWESLGDSEPQLSSPIQKATFSSVLLVPVTPRISSISVSFNAHLQHSYNPYTDPPPPQQSPRAPPFLLT